MLDKWVDIQEYFVVIRIVIAWRSSRVSVSGNILEKVGKYL